MEATEASTVVVAAVPDFGFSFLALLLSGFWSGVLLSAVAVGGPLLVMWLI